MRVVITGANRGIGEEVARQLAEMGHDIVGTRRHADAPHALDLADPTSVEAFAEGIDTLDVLIGNAAVSLSGFDADVARRTLAVNVLGTIDLTEALLPKLRPSGRVVLVSSGMGERSGFSGEAHRGLDDATAPRRAVRDLAERFVAQVAAGEHAAFGWPSSAYSASKALVNAYAERLARDVAEDERSLRVVAVCPGWVRTDMGGRGAPRSVAEGARGIVWAATDPGVPQGGFFRDGLRIRW